MSVTLVPIELKVYLLLSKEWTNDERNETRENALRLKLRYACE